MKINTSSGHFLQKKNDCKDLIKIMKICLLFLFALTFQLKALNTNAQDAVIGLKTNSITIGQLINEIERQTDYLVVYSNREVDTQRTVNFPQNSDKVSSYLNTAFLNTDIGYNFENDYIVLSKKARQSTTVDITRLIEDAQQQERTITGRVTDENGEPIIGATIVIKNNPLQGTITDINGDFKLTNIPEDPILQFTYVGMKSQEVTVEGLTTVNIIMESDIELLEEVVVVGYGTMRKKDLTGSVVSVGADELQDRPNVSLMQSLKGTVPGLNIGQINRAGQSPEFTIRGRTSISGELSPLIVLDGAIFRGNIGDINMNDVSTVDILKDASAAAVYGSQASNGVIIITSKKGVKVGKPVINYSASYSFQQPTVEITPETPEDYIKRVLAGYFLTSRTKESGYLDPNPDFNINTIFQTNENIWAYENGITTNWYDILTNTPYTYNHNLSLTQKNDNSNYFISIGYTEVGGYFVNEDYNRWNARINIDNSVTDWLDVGIQTFMTSTDLSGYQMDLNLRYDNWYAPAYDANGKLVDSPVGSGNNSYYFMQADDLNKRIYFFGNPYAEIKFPFLKGLSFKTNFNINYRTTSQYSFQSWANGFLGLGSKDETRQTSWTNDNILSYKRTFNKNHKVDVTMLYGVEKRAHTATTAAASNFPSHELGYNRLQSGDASLQKAVSNAWEEASLYSMGRLFYSYRNKYMITGTIRRDGFTGFSEKNKFGIFPSMALGWVISEEPFFKNNLNWFDYLKIRATYGANGNRTIGRYQTLATVDGGYNYVNGGVPIYTQSISGLASPNLKWETTTGTNIGIDFSFIKQRLNGSIEYYNNNTFDLLYNVDIPSISRYSTFPTNLGKIHNHGVEISLNSVNIEKKNFTWNSGVIFSLNRNELKELLGKDTNGDGIEDDLVSEQLFIGEPLSVVYDYSTSGKMYQLGDDIPSTADIGTFIIDDLNPDGVINELDKKILGYREPAYQFSISNKFRYKDWAFSFFINSKQGGKKYYLGADNLFTFNSFGNTNFERRNFPAKMDIWTPENPNARYQRQGASLGNAVRASRYVSRSFVRIEDVNLSYNIPQRHLDKFNIENLRLFFNGKNLWTFTKWNGWDPETGQNITSGGRPVLRNYTFGINITF